MARAEFVDIHALGDIAVRRGRGDFRQDSQAASATSNVKAPSPGPGPARRLWVIVRTTATNSRNMALARVPRGTRPQHLDAQCPGHGSNNAARIA